MKRSLIILIAVGVVVATVGLIVFKRQAALEAARQAERAAQLDRARDQARRTSAPAVAAPPARRARDSGLQDPQAREALRLVGTDAQANQIWAVAINNPDLSAEERQDLIEDLNEEGFPDPKNLTPEDLPLILSRIEIIEQLAPNAMDDVNADAFKEALKDLVNMRDRLRQN